MRNSLYKILLFIIVIILPQQLIMAQGKNIFGESTYIQSFKINEFGSLVFINDITEDSNGCMLLGTTDGITILSSEGGHNITTNSHSGVKHITRIHDGKILISGDVDNGYFTFGENGQAVYHDLNDNPSIKNENVIAILPCKSNHCYIGRNSIHILENGKTRKVKFSNMESAFAIDSLPIIITSDYRAYIFDGLHTGEIANLKKFGISSLESLKIVDTHNDTIILITNHEILKANKKDLLSGKIQDRNSLNIIKIDNAEYTESVINDAEYDDVLGKIAVSTSKGIFVFDSHGQLTSSIDTNNGLAQNDAGKLFFDSKHNLWVALRSKLAKIELNTHTVYYNERNGLNGEVYYYKKFNNQYYFSTFNEVYTAICSKYNTEFKPISFGPKENIICWNIQNIGNHLLACTSNGLYEISGAEAHKILNTGKIYFLATSPTHPNKVFMTCYNGIIMADYQEKDGKLTFGQPKNIRDIDVPMWTIQIDDRGNLWLASIFNGLYYLCPKDKDFERFSLVNIGENIGFKQLRQPKFKIRNNSLYTYGSAFLKAEIPENPNFSANEIILRGSQTFNNYIKKLSTAEIFPLNENGDLFINTEDECMIASRDDKSFDTIHFQTKIGLVNNVFMIDSLLFLSTNSGLLKHNTKALNACDPGNYPFNTIINGIYVNDSTVYEGFRLFDDKSNDYTMAGDGKNVFQNGIKSLKIKYTASCFENIDQLKYSYMLEGFRNKWSPYTSENSHEFGQLKPGKYTFRVRAINHTGLISSESVYSFTIKNSPWLRWWAISIYSSALALLVYILGRRLYFYKKENARLNSMNKMLSLAASKNTNSVIIVDSNGDFQWANPSFANFYGYEFEEYKNKFGTNYFQIQKATSADKEAAIDYVLAEKDHTSYVTMHTGPDGKNVYVQTHMDPVYDEENNIKNWIITETDITQLKLAEKEGVKQAEVMVEAYSDLMKNQDKLEFQTRQLKIINERLEIGYKQIKRQNITINQSLKYAQGLQNSIMPSLNKLSENMECSLVYWPKDIVSGDFYMSLATSENTFFTIVADCTGHGIPGAFMSIIGYDILCQLIIYHRYTEPAQILELMSNRMIEMLDMKRIENTDGIALSICRIDKHDDYADIIFAGSDSSIYIQKMETNTLQRFKGSRRQTGINGEKFTQKPFEQETIRVSYQDRIIQFTDGIIDQCNQDRRRYGTPRFEKLISENHDKPISDIGVLLETDMTKFMGDTEQRDDITVLIYNIKK